MKVVLRQFFFIFTLFSAILAKTQTTFSVSDTVQDVYKNTSFGTVHGYIQLTNLTQADLQLRWKLSITGKYPPSWIFSGADPDTNYAQLFDGDSADFILDLVSTTTNKIIYGLDHNQEAGSAQMHFYIFDPANPSENVTVHFNLYILDATDVNNVVKDTDFDIKNNRIIIKNPKNITLVEIITLSGKTLRYQQQDFDHNIQLPEKHQIYFIRIVKSSQEEINIKYFNR